MAANLFAECASFRLTLLHNLAKAVCVFRVAHHEVADRAVLQAELLRVCFDNFQNVLFLEDKFGIQASKFLLGELHDLVVRIRPEWLDNEDTSLTIKAFLDEAEYQTFKGLVAMKEDSYTFDIEG